MTIVPDRITKIEPLSAAEYESCGCGKQAVMRFTFHEPLHDETEQSEYCQDCARIVKENYEPKRARVVLPERVLELRRQFNS